jgi:hypothetical protein
MKSYLIVKVETDTDDRREHDELVERATSIIQDEGCGLTGFVNGWRVVDRRETRPGELPMLEQKLPEGVELTRSEYRSWRLYGQLATHLTWTSLEQWRPVMKRNLERLRSSVQGQPHLRNLDLWESLLDQSDLPGLLWALTSADRKPIEMREVAPFTGLLPEEERLEVLHAAAREREAKQADL